MVNNVLQYTTTQARIASSLWLYLQLILFGQLPIEINQQYEYCDCIYNLFCLGNYRLK